MPDKIGIRYKNFNILPIFLQSGKPGKKASPEFLFTLPRREDIIFLKDKRGESEAEGLYGFPTVKSALERQFEQAVTREYTLDQNGNRTEKEKYTVQFGEEDFVFYAADESDVDTVRELIGTLDTLYNYDIDINRIVEEEAAAFFAGQKTAEETAGIIQSRVRLYVSEHR